MEKNTKPEKSRRFSVRIAAAGFSGAWGAMQFPLAKTTLDFVYYGIHIDIYIPINVICFLGMIIFGVITVGTFLTNIKGNGSGTS